MCVGWRGKGDPFTVSCCYRYILTFKCFASYNRIKVTVNKLADDIVCRCSMYTIDYRIPRGCGGLNVQLIEPSHFWIIFWELTFLRSLKEGIMAFLSMPKHRLSRRCSYYCYLLLGCLVFLWNGNSLPVLKQVHIIFWTVNSLRQYLWNSCLVWLTVYCL